MVDFQLSPSLGVRGANASFPPAFTWIVPPCASADAVQTAYQIVVTREGAPVWDSGKTAGGDSTYVRYAGPPLVASARYSWTVTTWSDVCGASDPSDAALFIPALPRGGWAPGANFIALPAPGHTFGYFRKDIVVPAGTVSAVASLTGVLEDKLLSAYKLYVDGVFTNLGPGRGESRTWDGDGAFHSLPFQTLDLTAALTPGGHTLALEVMNKGGPLAIMQVAFFGAGGAALGVEATDASWASFNGDVHRNPGPTTHGGSAGTGFIEYIDARFEPVGWTRPGFAPSAGWAPAAAAAPTADQVNNLAARMQPPFQVVELGLQSIRPGVPHPAPGVPAECGEVDENEVLTLGCKDGSPIQAIAFASFGTPGGGCGGGFSKGACDSKNSLPAVQAACVGKTMCAVSATNNFFGGDPCYDTPKTLAVALGGCPGPAPPPQNATSWVATFPQEFQGGLRLAVSGGVAGSTAAIACGESLNGDTVGSTWGWEFTWTLRDGDQMLEQHKYMECRFVSLTFSAAPAAFTLSAWQASYPFVEEDSYFHSDNATLDAVYDLCRYTVHAAALDTYTDSNTRERTPYEADGVIAASGRILVQRDVLFPRHSHAYVLNAPTWPVEWKQLSPFLGWQDFMNSGQPDLALAFTDVMHERSGIPFLEAATGVIKTDKMGSHIVDWMPDADERDETVERGEFTASPHMSVTNFFTAHGLDLLAQMVAAGGRNGSGIAAEAAALTANIRKQMWNGTAFCDGICSEVGGNSRVMTNMFSLAFGLVPPASVDSVWGGVAAWGLEQMGDYGAFWYQMAVASGYYAPHYDTPDDGTAIVTALTKCDYYSWCSGLAQDNLTMTRESWHAGTYSHGWGSSAIVGVSWGVLGVHNTAPGWAAFTVMPKLGPLQFAVGQVPNLRGFVTVNATAGWGVEVGVPCGSAATLCTPRSAADGARRLTTADFALLLDGSEVRATERAGHLCTAQPVGCGAAGAPRQLRAQRR